MTWITCTAHGQGMVKNHQFIAAATFGWDMSSGFIIFILLPFAHLF